MISIHGLLADLATVRPVFHSEADFQHAFAWLLQRRNPELSVRLEVPIQVDASVFRLDVLASSGDGRVAVELKYKSRAISCSAADEEFRLTNHAAQDLGRYDYIKDILRLERLASAHPQTSGYAVLLTNDPGYWTQARGVDSVDAAFRLQPRSCTCWRPPVARSRLGGHHSRSRRVARVTRFLFVGVARLLALRSPTLGHIQVSCR